MSGNRTPAAGRPSRMRRRLALSIFVCIALVACGKSAISNGPPPSGIQGTVMVGPQCPVMQADSPCPDTPFTGKVEVRRGASLVTTVQVAADGTYRVELDPGTYVLLPLVRTEGGPPSVAPTTVVVQSHGYTTANLTVDTGIR